MVLKLIQQFVSLGCGEHFALLQFSFFFSDDYLLITNEKNKSFGKYCGQKSGDTTWVTGNHTVITFHSGNNSQRKRLLLRLVAVAKSGM